MIFRKILLKLLSKTISLDDRNDIEEKKFLNHLSTNKGWKSYVAIRDLSLMRQMAEGVSEKKYIGLLGQREELFHLVDLAIKYQRIKDLDSVEKVDMEVKGINK